MESKFVHSISKGSRFNQIYIPKNMQGIFEAGDIVEVKIIEKKSRLFYSKSFKQLSNFKENIIKEIFLLLRNFEEIEQVFIVGSFLTKIDYKDIDIMIMLKNKQINEKILEKKIYDILISKLQLNFHLLLIQEDKFNELEKKCPLTRNMLSCFVSNKLFKLNKETILDKNHIKFLLMMPEDLLEINTSSRVFYDNLRRLIAIERFLWNKTINSEDVENELRKLAGRTLFNYLRNNEQIDNKIIDKLRKIIKTKLEKVKNKIE